MVDLAIKRQFATAYKHIQTIQDDANRQIRNFNLKTIAKITAILTFFTVIGVFALELALLAATPVMFLSIIIIRDHMDKHLFKMTDYIKRINLEMQRKQRRHTLCIREAISLNNVANTGYITIPRAEMQSFADATESYQSDYRRYLPGFLQFSIPNSEKMAVMIAGVGVGLIMGFHTNMVINNMTIKK